jgi:hypothetical protein
VKVPHGYQFPRMAMRWPPRPSSFTPMWTNPWHHPFDASNHLLKTDWTMLNYHIPYLSVFDRFACLILFIWPKVKEVKKWQDVFWEYLLGSIDSIWFQ